MRRKELARQAHGLGGSFAGQVEGEACLCGVDAGDAPKAVRDSVIQGSTLGTSFLECFYEKQIPSHSGKMLIPLWKTHRELELMKAL